MQDNSTEPQGHLSQGQPSQPFPPQYPAQPSYPPGYYPPPQPPGYYPPQQQYPPYQPPYYPYQQPPWPPPRRMNHHADMAQTFGILSLFLGILCGIPAIIFGVMAISEIKLTGEDGTTRANTGLFLGILSIVLTGTYYYWFFVRR